MVSEHIQKLEEVRKRYNLSKHRLAEAVGINRLTLWRWSKLPTLPPCARKKIGRFLRRNKVALNASKTKGEYRAFMSRLSHSSYNVLDVVDFYTWLYKYFIKNGFAMESKLENLNGVKFLGYIFNPPFAVQETYFLQMYVRENELQFEFYFKNKHSTEYRPLKSGVLGIDAILQIEKFIKKRFNDV